jgi:hypothetical protein
MVIAAMSAAADRTSANVMGANVASAPLPTRLLPPFIDKRRRDVVLTRHIRHHRHSRERRRQDPNLLCFALPATTLGPGQPGQLGHGGVDMRALTVGLCVQRDGLLIGEPPKSPTLRLWTEPLRSTPDANQMKESVTKV